MHANRFRRSIRRVAAAGAVTGFAALAVAGTASAHVSPVDSEAAAGSYTIVYLKVPHGCDGEATNKVEIQVPAGVDEVTPVVVPGWKAAVATEKLATPTTDEEGTEVTERDSSVTWTAEAGNELPDHQLQLFGLSLQVPDQVGETLYFKTIQTCASGTAEWIQEWDGTGEEPDKPAPSVKIVAAVEGESGHHGSTETTAASGTSSTTTASSASSSASSDKDDDGASTGLSIAALALGAIGAGLGGAAFAKSRKA